MIALEQNEKLQQDRVVTTRLQQTGTWLNEAAGTHARILERVLDRYSVDKAAVAARLPPNRVLNPSCFYPEPRPTKVVRMNLDQDLADNLRRQLRLQAVVARSFSDTSVGTYSPVSTMFENSVLFVPSAKRFYDLNQDVVHEYFPEVETTVVNAFVVPGGKRPYGTHSASGIALQIPSLVKKGLGFPKHYMSFHTALTPTPLTRQPFVIFEDAEVEAPNLQFAYQRLMTHDLSEQERDSIGKALYLYTEGKLSEIDLPTVRDFLMAKYWEKRYASSPSSGYYHECKVGEGLFFNNYRAHGDNTLPEASEDRVTIDFRCFSKVSYPAGMSSGLDFIVDPAERTHQRTRKWAAIEFLLMALGYEDMNEFLRVVFGTRHLRMDPFDLITDLQFGVYNRSKYHLLDQKLDAHYERVERLYEQIEEDGGYTLPARAREYIERLSRK
jgi:hypothetical protein